MKARKRAKTLGCQIKWFELWLDYTRRARVAPKGLPVWEDTKYFSYVSWRDNPKSFQNPSIIDFEISKYWISKYRKVWQKWSNRDKFDQIGHKSGHFWSNRDAHTSNFWGFSTQKAPSGQILLEWYKHWYLSDFRYRLWKIL